MATHINWRDPLGNLLTIITQYSSLDYIRAENKVGWLTLEINPTLIPTSFLAVNARLEPWRSVGAYSPYLDGESVFFLRNWTYAIDDAGQEVLRLSAFDANYLLDSRIVAYAAGSAQAERTNEIDDMMKSIVRDNLGVDATDTLRNLSPYLTVQVDVSAAPSTTKAFSRRNVLVVLQELADIAFKLGTYLAFDIVYTGSTTLEFRTFTGQRGVNLGRTSANTLVVSRERRNLESPQLIEDHETEENYIYAGGQGTETDRVIKTAYTTTALGLNRRELFVDAAMSELETSVQAEADAALFDYRAKKTLIGRIVDTTGCRYGVHYHFGDLVYAEYKGQGYDAHIDAVHITVQDGAEIIDTQIRASA
jgi:hypothetical protein